MEKSSDLLILGSSELLPPEAIETLLENGRQWRAAGENPEERTAFFPVVKLFTPDASCIWLLSELDPGCPDMAWGLCDLGIGYPELAYVRQSELEAVRGALDLPVLRDPYFTPEKPVGKYAQEAKIAGRACGRILP